MGRWLSNLDNDVIWDSIKCFEEVQEGDIHRSSLLYLCCNPIIGGHQICRHDLPSKKPCWLPPITSMFSTEYSFQGIWFKVFLGIVRLTGLYFSDFSFFAVLKLWVIFLLLQSLGTSQDCQKFSNMMDSGLDTSSAIRLIHFIRSHGLWQGDGEDRETIYTVPLKLSCLHRCKLSAQWCILTVNHLYKFCIRFLMIYERKGNNAFMLWILSVCSIVQKLVFIWTAF